MSKNRPPTLPQTLQEAIILQAVDDLRKALRNGDTDLQRDCERFFRSKLFTALTDIDGPALLERLRKENPMPKEKTAMPKPNNPIPSEREIMEAELAETKAKLKDLQKDLRLATMELDDKERALVRLRSENEQLRRKQAGGLAALKAKLYDIIMKELEESHV